MNSEFEKVLSYIFQNDLQINLLQIDTEVKQHISSPHFHLYYITKTVKNQKAGPKDMLYVLIK